MSPEKEVKQTFVTLPCCRGALAAPVTPTPSAQIYRATFGRVTAVRVDKAGYNVCHPITTEIYLPDRHIRLQGPACRLAVEQAGGGGQNGDRTALQTAYYHQFDTVDS